MDENRNWVRNVRVCKTLDAEFYVCYEDKTHRLRLTHRGTWSPNDMDIYWKTRGEAYGALAVAPCPLDDPQGVAGPHPYPLTLDGAVSAMPERWTWRRYGSEGWRAFTTNDGLLQVNTPRTGNEIEDRYRLAAAARQAEGVSK